MKDEVNKLRGTITLLQGNIKELQERNKLLERKYIDVEEELQTFITSRRGDAEIIAAVAEEVSDRTRRRCNVVIHGIPENSSTDSEDSDLSTVFLKLWYANHRWYAEAVWVVREKFWANVIKKKFC